MSDLYVGLMILARFQAEEKANAMKQIASKSKQIEARMKRDSTEKNHCTGVDTDKAQSPDHNADDSNFDIFPGHISYVDAANERNRCRRSTLIFQSINGSFQMCERDLLSDSNTIDQSALKDGGTFSRYARIIYSRLREVAVDEFHVGKDEFIFERDVNTLFQRDYALSSIDMESTLLIHANFESNLIKTPYAILVDESEKKVIITVRGTLSLEDCVVDMQYTPYHLDKVGNTCGFNGNGHYAHQGFLTRSKWIYNEIKQ